MPEILAVIALALVQGATEFLPISSSGHLILGEWLFGLNTAQYGYSFDMALTLGTTCALLSVTYQDLMDTIRTGLRKGSEKTPQRMFLWALVISTTITGLLGLLLQDTITSTLRSPLVVAGMLVVVSIIFLLADRTTTLRKSTLVSTTGIGIAQALAFVPGVSRSGITISMARFSGLSATDAVRTSFLLSVPITLLAAGKGIADALQDGRFTALYVVGGSISFVVGRLVLRYFLQSVARTGLTPYAYYRIALAIIVVTIWLLQRG